MPSCQREPPDGAGDGDGAMVCRLIGCSCGGCYGAATKFYRLAAPLSRCFLDQLATVVSPAELAAGNNINNFLELKLDYFTFALYLSFDDYVVMAFFCIV